MRSLKDPDLSSSLNTLSPKTQVTLKQQGCGGHLGPEWESKDKQRIFCQKQMFCVDFTLTKDVQMESKTFYKSFRHVSIQSSLNTYL